jgi:hypothetical protein
VLIGVLPTWPHSKAWGYYPSGGNWPVGNRTSRPALAGAHLGASSLNHQAED